MPSLASVEELLSKHRSQLDSFEVPHDGSDEELTKLTGEMAAHRSEIESLLHLYGDPVLVEAFSKHRPPRRPPNAYFVDDPSPPQTNEDEFAHVRRVKVVLEKNLTNVLDRVVAKKNVLHAIGSQGDAADSVVDTLMAKRRGAVDRALGQVGMAGHLDRLVSALSDGSDAQAKSVLWAVRDVLHDLVRTIMPDTEGAHRGQPMNHWRAYLRTVGSGTTRELLAAEIKSLETIVAKLNGQANKGHDPLVRSEEAECAVVALYAFLGEVLERTGFEQVRRAS